MYRGVTRYGRKPNFNNGAPPLFTAFAAFYKIIIKSEAIIGKQYYKCWVYIGHV